MMASGSTASGMGLRPSVLPRRETKRRWSQWWSQWWSRNNASVSVWDVLMRQGKLTYSSDGPSFYDGGWQAHTPKAVGFIMSAKWQSRAELVVLRFQRLDRSMAMANSQNFRDLGQNSKAATSLVIIMNRGHLFCIRGASLESLHWPLTRHSLLGCGRVEIATKVSGSLHLRILGSIWVNMPMSLGRDNSWTVPRLGKMHGYGTMIWKNGNSILAEVASSVNISPTQSFTEVPRSTLVNG